MKSSNGRKLPVLGYQTSNLTLRPSEYWWLKQAGIILLLSSDRNFLGEVSNVHERFLTFQLNYTIKIFFFMMNTQSGDLVVDAVVVFVWLSFRIILSCLAGSDEEEERDTLGDFRLFHWFFLAFLVGLSSSIDDTTTAHTLCLGAVGRMIKL